MKLNKSILMIFPGFLKKLTLSGLFLCVFFAVSSFSAVKNLSERAVGITGDGDLPNWALLDPEKDGYEGTRTLTFYRYLETLDQRRERKPVIVAVIDSGFDINHPDLKDNIWQNTKEINGIAGTDDDGNGYVDDFHGWNFLGDVKYLPLEVTREYYRLKRENVAESDPYFRKVIEEFESEKEDTESNYEFAGSILRKVEDAERTLSKRGYSSDPETLKKLSNSLDGQYLDAANYILGLYSLQITKQELVDIEKSSGIEKRMLAESPGMDALKKIGDDPENLSEKGYGNNNLYVEDETHGTHVAGIIASKKEGIGQAPFATLMLLRAVPNEGDERDKDVGNAIRYAVDNGANIINMSAGKYFSRHPQYVIDAIKYAEEKGVLFVNSAGNESVDIEEVVNYPAKFYRENGQIKHFSNVVVVGASSWMTKWNDDKDPDNLNGNYDLAAPFSNYSERVVDVFAPGVEINSTIPGSKYERISGTSMASPEVAGIAAVIKAYFPDLTAAQIKEVLVSSVRRYDGLKVRIPGKNSKVPFSELSRSGGIVDMMNAFQKAEQISTN
jgi:subtilisin family serine protease